jgi:hypothetical protein
MKLRFDAHSLRLRLSQPEIALLQESGRIENHVTFAPAETLVYSIELGPVSELTATYAGGCIRVILPSAVARQWIESEEAGIEGDSSTLKVLIEKDFPCLHRAENEV